MHREIHLYTSLLIILSSCETDSKRIENEKFIIDGDTITSKVIVSDDPNDAKYNLVDLSSEENNSINERLKIAEDYIIRYNGYLPQSKYDAITLDSVFNKWLNYQTEKADSIVFLDAMGAALGQDIVDNLNCEWKITDQYGSDFTVIHKNYFINCFPFAMAEKAFGERKNGFFHTIKLLMKKGIKDAVQKNTAKIR